MNQERLMELLDYNPFAGKFTWRVNGRGKYVRVGATAGTIRKNGYRQIRVDGTIYLASRLAVLWMTGFWPSKLVDHANGIRDDNCWSNLRQADHSTNGANSAPHKRKAVSLKGVCWEPRRRHYVASIYVRGRPHYLGSFNRVEEAHLAYVAAARIYFGEYAYVRK